MQPPAQAPAGSPADAPPGRHRTRDGKLLEHLGHEEGMAWEASRDGTKRASLTSGPWCSCVSSPCPFSFRSRARLLRSCSGPQESLGAAPPRMGEDCRLWGARPGCAAPLTPDSYRLILACPSPQEVILGCSTHSCPLLPSVVLLIHRCRLFLDVLVPSIEDHV